MAPVSTIETFEEAQEIFLQKIKEDPRLKPVAAKKLLDLAKELDASTEEKLGDLSLQLPAEERIKQGFLKFKNNFWLKNPKLYEKLSAGQSPKFMIFACSDSRVCPTTILGLQPGEAFVVRNIASMIPACGEAGFPSTSAALEYGVLHLKVEHILVIGHSRCGGIKALLTTDPEKKWSDYIQDWIKISTPVHSNQNHSHDIDERCSCGEKESVNVSLSNLMTFPWIKSAVEEKKLALHGGHYSFVTGTFQYWTPGSDKVDF
ncbi:carbonic anhydrase 2 [Selaginella moellendorffii]|nr:carbonic anhydrase 2 [Selaginella moellendorffii]|eukprot:XP_002977578.2 carbonic anhydrase 2 [Selaginella moellendorffii]